MLRRVLQAGVILFVVYTAFGGAWRNFKMAHNQGRLVGLMEGDVAAFFYELNEDALSLLGEPAEASLMFLGFPWASRFFGLEGADPILVAAHAVSTGSVPVDLLAGLLVPLWVAFLFGKAFCSHLCPMRSLFELGQRARAGLVRLGLPLREPRRHEARFGGWVLLGGLVATAFAGTAVWLFILPYVSFAAGVFLLVTTSAATGLLAVVGFWLLVDVLIAPGWWCHNACPTGWLLEQMGRVSLLQLVNRGQEPCPSGCNVCERACPYTLSPKHDAHRPACDNCGTCVTACPQRRLVRRLVVLPAVLLAFAIPGTASAHHNKGLPHYGYFDNYPQVPTEEYIAIDGRWEIGATFFNFQGYDRRNADTPNDVKIFLYLYDLEADAAYRGALDVDIRYDGRVVAHFDRLEVDEEAVYSTRETLPASGDYELVALVDGREVVLPFHVELASDQVDWWLIGGIGGPVLLLFLLALHGRRRRRRKKPSAAATAAVALGLLLATLSLPAAAQESPPDDRLLASTSAECLCGDDGTVECPPLSVGLLSPGETRVRYPAYGHGMGTHEHYETEEGAVMVMDGVPLWLVLLGVAGVILLSFVATERWAPKVGRGFRLDLLRRRRVYAFVRSRWFQAVPQLLMVGVLGALIYVGLFGSPLANATPVVVWTLWWAGLIFAVLVLASAWCFVCPWDGLANLATRLRAAARVETLSLSLRFPSWAKNVYPAIALFVILTWLELGWGVTTDARATAYMGLGMAGMAVAAALLWDGKRFCAHMCPVGRICGIYSTFSPIEIRARKPRACLTCTTEDCLNGNERGYPCPTGLSLKVLQSSAHCTMCTECVKSCNRQNVAVNLRPFGSDLRDVRAPRLDEAWLAVVLLSLTLFHGLSMTPVWEGFAPGSASILKGLQLGLGVSRTASFTIAMVVACALPVGLYSLCCVVAARWAGAGRPEAPRARELFVRYAYSLLPIALFYHLAHNLMHLLMEGGEAVPLLSDPMGTGADYLGTRGVQVGGLVSETTLGALQVGLILVGHVFGVLVAHRLGRGLYDDPRARTRSLVPMTAMMILLSVAGLSLMHMDMNMRLGRM